MYWHQREVFDEFEFIELAVQAGHDGYEAEDTFEALFYDWRLEDWQICKSFDYTCCVGPHHCNWRRTCKGIHAVRFSTLATGRVWKRELLEIPRFAFNGNPRPYYTEERIEILRDVRDAARRLYIAQTGIQVDLRRAA